MFRRIPASHRRRSQFLRLERLEERATPADYGPTQIRHAYGFDQVAEVNGTPLTGAGQTIAIVDAYYDPYAASDLAMFDADYGLPAPPSFQQVSQTGGSPSSYSQNSGWGGETALDIEWAHAIAPGANILLVEAANQNNNGANLLTAVDYARSQTGVSVVSMSWGYSEFSNETTSSYTTHFTTPSGHVGGVSFVAASGDNGQGTIFPSIEPNVLSVGGTSLTLTNGNYGSESAWSGSGGGPSAYFSKPSYQTAYTGSARANPDVAYDADPGTGVDMYNSYNGGLEIVGGTSAGAPQWAGLIALADQGRSLMGLGTLDGGSQLLPAIYSMPASNYNDITTGSNGYNATVGYDLATGLGTPKAQLVIGALVAYGASAAPAITTQPAGQSVTVGQSATFTAAASGIPTPTVQWQISTNGGATFTNISGATSVSYATGATVSTENGYEYRAVFTNGIGAPATTNAATLTIASAPTVTTQPASQSVTVGQTATFTAVAIGNPAPNVQWQVTIVNNSPFYTNISGATGTTYSFIPTLADSGKRYRALFTNSAGGTTSNYAALTVVAPVTVANVQVGDGTVQRSEVRSIAVTFSGPVSFAGGNANAAAAFQLLHVQTGNIVVLTSVVSTDSQGRTVVTLFFSGAETDSVSAENGGIASLADGRYTLTIIGGSITDANGAALDGAGTGTPGSNYVSPTDTQGGGTGQLQLFRLFGDLSGDGLDDQIDLGTFRTAYNTVAGDPNYNPLLDANNDGKIDQIDLGEFRNRNNTSVF